MTLRRIMPALLVVVSFAAWGRGQTPSPCDRACLKGFISQYLDAMVAHEPGKLALASNVRFTEDTVELKLGEGLWKTASKLRPYRQDFLDVRQGVAASHVVVEESGAPVMLALRLKVVDRKLTEVETMVVRNRTEGALFNIEALQTARPEMNVVPPKNQLLSREEAIRIAEYYPAGLKIGSFVTVDAPFAPNAYRIENGATMAGPGCTRGGCEDIKAQSIIPHPAMSHRLAAVDEELGLVLYRMDFGDTNSYGAGKALTLWEAFKVYDGKIHAVEAFMEIMPAGASSGWK